MTATLVTSIFIMLWLLSGFAAAYVSYRWVDSAEFNYGLGQVIFIACIGPAAFILMALYVVMHRDIVIFKRKVK